MKYNYLGSTGLYVSEIGFGGIPIQRITKDEAAKVIQRAQELGINFIDTARGYTVSEEYIGYALKGRRDKWIIASKSMVRDKNLMDKEINISLKNLNTDYIDLYQIHNVKDICTYDKVISQDGAYEALYEAKIKGKIRHIGITVHSADILKKAVESRLFETIMFPYNIVETQGEYIFKRAKELNIGVIAMKPLAGGTIKDANLAIRFILQNKNVTIVIPGMASINEVEENVLAAEKGNLSQSEIEMCKKISWEIGKDFCRRCGYCAPCPQGIDISFCFLLKLYYNNYNLKDWANERYKELKAHAEDCRECGICEERCPYNLSIRKKLKEVKTVFGF